MAEYVEREMAIRAVLNDYPEQVGYSREDAADCIRYMDAADVAPVRHGYWYEHYGIAICSHCQSMFDHDLKMLQVPSTWKMPNYCPNCGAKMDVDTELKGGVNR